MLDFGTILNWKWHVQYCLLIDSWWIFCSNEGHWTVWPRRGSFRRVPSKRNDYETLKGWIWRDDWYAPCLQGLKFFQRPLLFVLLNSSLRNIKYLRPKSQSRREGSTFLEKLRGNERRFPGKNPAHLVPIVSRVPLIFPSKWIERSTKIFYSPFLLRRAQRRYAWMTLDFVYFPIYSPNSSS